MEINWKDLKVLNYDKEDPSITYFIEQTELSPVLDNRGRLYIEWFRYMGTVLGELESELGLFRGSLSH